MIERLFPGRGHTSARRSAARTRSALVALAGAGALLGPAQAEVVMMLNASHNNMPSGISSLAGPQWGPAQANYDADALRLRGHAAVTRNGAGVQFVPDATLSPCVYPCQAAFSAGESAVNASVDASTGVYRGWVRSETGYSLAQPVLPPQRESSQASATWGTVDVLSHIQGGQLELSLAMDAAWRVVLAENSLDPGNVWTGGASIGARVGLSHTLCLGPECISVTDAEITFQGGGQADSNGQHSSGWRFSGEAQHDGTGVDHQLRSLLVTGLSPDVDYELWTEFTIGTHCYGMCGAFVDFANTGFVGVVGDYVSANGYGYLGRTVDTPPPPGSVPTPATLPLLLAGIGAAAVSSVRPRRRRS